MNKVVLILFAYSLLISCQQAQVKGNRNEISAPVSADSAKSASDSNLNLMTMIENIHWIDQASVAIKTEKVTFYVDPFHIKNPDKSDLVLITHSHSDHLSPDDIAKISDSTTILIAPKDVIYNGPIKERLILKPGETYSFNDSISIEAVPAYNVVKTNFHPKENNWVGYIITINGIRIYHTGDTERIPEMKNISCDIIMLPLGQTYTMNSVEEAAEAVLDTKASIAIPIHFGLYEGKETDAQKLKEILTQKVDVIIKQKEN